MTLKRNRANFEFTIHLDINKGPNRTTYEPNKASQFFKKMVKRNQGVTTMGVKVKHLASNLVWETDDPTELEYFNSTFVESVGVTQHG